MRTFKSTLSLAICFLISVALLENRIEAESHFREATVSAKIREEIVSDTWMGVYMSGVKVGYNHYREIHFSQSGVAYKKDINESWMKVSRLGGNPVEMMTVQESLYDAKDNPLETKIRTKMSKSETMMSAEIHQDKILFKSGERLTKELPYEETFYLGIPVKKIIAKEGLSQRKKYHFKILDLFSHSLVDSIFEVIGKEDVFILGKKMSLWHVKTEMVSIVPIVVDEWIDEDGATWKSMSQASFITTTSIRLSKEKALEISDGNFDIAFSSIIRSNVTFENPQEIQRVTFKLWGIPVEKIIRFPFDDNSQEILEAKEDYVLIQTSSVIFKEEEAITFPVGREKFRNFLKPTEFCQSDDPRIRKISKEIAGEERNAWTASKKIAEWVKNEMTPNYDVGFASAKEVLRNREGDCSEYTVLVVALCRALGIPARAAVGIMYAQGLFAYHMWPEVYVGRWVGLDAKWLARDKRSGEYYTDATHLKFGRSSLDENVFQEMVQAISEIIGQLKLEIIDYYRDK